MGVASIRQEKRGEGHGTLTIHRAGRTAELPLAGAGHQLDPRSVRQVCEALGLDWSSLPGPRAASDRAYVCPLLARSGH